MVGSGGVEGGTGNIHEINKTTGAASFAFNSGILFADLASNPKLIPEPSTALLVGIGLAGMAARRPRRSYPRSVSGSREKP